MKLLLISCLILIGLSGHSGKEVLKKMHTAHAGSWHRSATFEQTTGRYKNDSLVSTAIWREAIAFPDNLRIDMGPKEKGNSIIFTRDSTYNFRNGNALKASTEKNDLIFLIGGMYFYPLDAVAKILTSMGYDLSRAFETKWAGKEVYVIGVNDSSDKLNQLWIDKERLILLRMIKFEKGTKQEAIFENHQKLPTSWMETKVRFYVNDRLIQTEEYKNIDANVSLDPRIFDPMYFGKVSWY